MQIEGRNPVLEALKADNTSLIKKIFVEKNINQKNNKIKTILSLARKRHIDVKFLKKYLLDKKSQTKNHQGVIAIKKILVSKTFSDLTNERNAFLIYIREALYEHNIGAIIRTAEIFNMTGVILPPKIKITPQIVRASMGATEHINIINYNLFQAIKMAKDKNISVIGIERSSKATDLTKVKLKLPIMLIIGGEDRSLSKEILNKCDKTIMIPMKGKINSLNMSVAAAITIYEIFKQNL